jgi:hypothetical protein
MHPKDMELKESAGIKESTGIKGDVVYCCKVADQLILW